MNRSVTVLMMMATLLAGCEERDSTPVSQLDAQRRAILGTTGGDGKILLIRVLVGSVEAPLGAVSESQDLFSYLDCDGVRTIGSGDLGRNGIRVGAGRAQTWADVAGILQALTARPVLQRSVLVLPGKVAHLVFQEDQRAKTIFLEHKDRTFTGNDYPRGDYMMAVSFSMDEDEPTKLLMTASPLIQSADRGTKIVKEDGRYLMAERPTLYPIEPLVFQLEVAAEDFIIIAPNAESRRPTSIGNGMFIHPEGGLAFETVFILRPQLVTQKPR